MIQDLLDTPTFVNGKRKVLPINGGLIFQGTPHHRSPPLFHPCLLSLVAPPSSHAATVPESSLAAPPSSHAATVPESVGTIVDAPPTKNHSSNSSMSSSDSENNKNLRCPRCDSSNTKFCYYNNYNLTQPRYFCMTCRRYWTKGGALRNVPIGRGCRKKKSSASSSPAISGISSQSGGSKFKNLVSEQGRPALIPGFEHEIIMPPNPLFWATGHHNSHILSLLKRNAKPKPNSGVLPLSRFLSTKEEASLLRSHLMPEPVFSGHSDFTIGSLGIEPFGHHHNHSQQQNCVSGGGELQNSGMQLLYQRMRSPTGYNYFPESHGHLVTPVIQRNTDICTHTTTSPISSSSPMLEPIPAATSELGYWNPAFSMSYLSTNIGAYP